MIFERRSMQGIQESTILERAILAKVMKSKSSLSNGEFLKVLWTSQVPEKIFLRIILPNYIHSRRIIELRNIFPKNSLCTSPHQRDVRGYIICKLSAKKEPRV
eukprot:TRINITY_DN4569_c0_g3_i1.p3 TRINITY_DN4569_c0_g3~~TRINITY_DN4569_c0_g3_i1.p3  ORF type:complete len:103 (-),score=0.76 TRINITY_DN4569_c0_g3_i1:503-811(-)